jgi:hypothetical protein
MGWTAGVRFLAGERDFSVPHIAQTSSGAHPAPYPGDNEGFAPGVKLPGREADHWHPSNAEVKDTSPHTYSGHGALIK